ncbi:hypothetical protein [Geomobilimonas luticola]|uniref:Uncharacterized protein n=1 Tax=Geomobilimonas luticola TaxID=1114878 RepID=A0ABS5SGW3_9BACT|nr:hypothetical protein [Geomobilimonas luticola]MBT0654606.1 hypothetical protein [Geomobilimonas luticola]
MRLGYLLPLFLVLLTTSLSGCGNDTSVSQTKSNFAASETCITCHSAQKTVSPVTLASVTDEWYSSLHNIKKGASCIDCHGSGNGHPSTCGSCHGGATTVGLEFHNPVAAGRCYNCHGVDATVFPLGKGKRHFDIYTTSNAVGTKVPTATYVGTQNTCSNCHAPHKNDLLPQHREWAESGHGKVDADPWIHYTFNTRNTCNRCHTTTGFLKYIKTGNDSAWATKGEQEMLRCNGCHSDYRWARIPSIDFRTPYTPSLQASSGFPTDIGDTKLCIPCHAGLNSGYAIETTTADLTKTSFGTFNSHYMAAAGLMFVKNGFTGFADPTAMSGTLATKNGVSNTPVTYGESLTSSDDGGVLTSTHRKFGTAAMKTDSHPGGRDLVTGGPCVTCHLSGKHHTLKIDAFAFNNICVKCHSKEGTTLLTADNFGTVFIEEQAAIFQNAIMLARTLLHNTYGIDYDSANYPYFFPVGEAHDRDHGFTDWTLTGTLTGSDAKKLLGVCFNINLLSRDPAAYAHARTYARRLLYDSIDFLDDRTMNHSVSATIATTDPAHFTNGGTSALSSPSFNYLVKFNGPKTDGTNATLDTSTERP